MLHRNIPMIGPDMPPNELGRNAAGNVGSPLAGPMSATMAAASLRANRLLAQQVQLSYIASEHARAQAAAAEELIETWQPDGPVRSALLSLLKLQQQLASNASHNALAAGRNFGHLAFAFPVLV
jgi:hypothetical protein